MSKLQRYCRACGTQIPEARVAALPTAVHCVPCAEGRVPKKMGVTQLVGGEEHGFTDLFIVEETMLDAVEQRDLMDVEPEQFAKDPRVPLKIRKRNEL